MDEFHVTAFSNASTEKYYRNKLTHFKNDLPIDFHLDYKDKWHVCLESIGFASKYKSILLPEKTNVPSIRIYIRTAENKKPVSYYKDYYEFFPPEVRSSVLHRMPSLNHAQHIVLLHDVIFPGEIIDQQTINDSFKFLKEKEVGLKFIINKKNRVEVLYTSTKSDFYYIFIHESFKNSFGLPINVKYALKDVKDFEGEKYYAFPMSNERENIYGEKEKWYGIRPDLIRVKCAEINNQIFNGQLTKDLSVFCPSFHEKSSYSLYQFETEQYVPISNTILNTLSLSVTDGSGRYLNVPTGVATFMKLKFKKMSNSKDFFNVRICSEKNDNNNFKIDLPQTYYLDSSWKVALTSINFPSNIKPLPNEEKYRSISVAKFGKNYGIRSVENKNYTLEKLVDEINKYTTEGGGIFRIQKNVENGIENSSVILRLDRGTAVMIPVLIGEILGFQYLSFLPKEYDIDIVVRNDEYVIFYNNRDYDWDFHFNEKANMNNIKPEYFMIYTDIIESVIVGDTYAKLLKIVPSHNNYEETYVIEEFKHQELHALESTLLKSISIEIRSHTGSFVNFPDKKKIFMNLLFTR